MNKKQKTFEGGAPRGGGSKLALYIIPYPTL